MASYNNIHIETLEEPENNITYEAEVTRFVLSDLSTAIYNGIRRIILSDIECYAMSLITIKVNTTNMADEFIKQRISLIHVNNTVGNSKDVSFSLKVSCPKEETSRDFYSSDIISSDGVIYFNQEIYLGTIMTDKALEMIIKTAKGTAHEHSIYSCVTNVKYKEVEDTGASAGDGTSAIYGNNAKAILMEVESAGQYSAKKIPEMAFDILKDKIKTLDKTYNTYMTGAKLEVKDIIDIVEEKDYIEIHLYKENHTLCNIIITEINNRNSTIKFCEYRQVHPLKNDFCMVICDDKPHEVFKNALKTLLKTLEKVYFTEKKSSKIVIPVKKKKTATKK